MRECAGVVADHRRLLVAVLLGRRHGQLLQQRQPPGAQHSPAGVVERRQHIEAASRAAAALCPCGASQSSAATVQAEVSQSHSRHAGGHPVPPQALECA